MRFVEDDVLERGEQLGPVFAVREQRIVQAVGIGDQDVRRRILQAAPYLLLGVPVEGPGRDTVRLRERDSEALDGKELVVREGLGRVEIERVLAAVLPQSGDDREVEAERLTRSGRRDEHDVTPGSDLLDRSSLMLVEQLDAVGAAGIDERFVQARRKRSCIRCRHRFQGANAPQVLLAKDACLSQGIEKRERPADTRHASRSSTSSTAYGRPCIAVR